MAKIVSCILILPLVILAGCVGVNPKIINLTDHSWVVDLGPGYRINNYREQRSLQQYHAALEARMRNCKNYTYDSSLKTGYPLSRARGLKSNGNGHCLSDTVGLQTPAMVYRCTNSENSFLTDEIIKLNEEI